MTSETTVPFDERVAAKLQQWSTDPTAYWADEALEFETSEDWMELIRRKFPLEQFLAMATKIPLQFGQNCLLIAYKSDFSKCAERYYDDWCNCALLTVHFDNPYEWRNNDDKDISFMARHDLEEEELKEVSIMLTGFLAYFLANTQRPCRVEIKNEFWNVDEFLVGQAFCNLPPMLPNRDGIVFELEGVTFHARQSQELRHFSHNLFMRNCHFSLGDEGRSYLECIGQEFDPYSLGLMDMRVNGPFLAAAIRRSQALQHFVWSPTVGDISQVTDSIVEEAPQLTEIHYVVGLRRGIPCELETKDEWIANLQKLLRLPNLTHLSYHVQVQGGDVGSALYDFETATLNILSRNRNLVHLSFGASIHSAPYFAEQLEGILLRNRLYADVKVSADCIARHRAQGLFFKAITHAQVLPSAYHMHELVRRNVEILQDCSSASTTC